MMKITKRINELLETYRTVFLVQFPRTGGITAYVQNVRDVDYICMFWTKVTDDDVLSGLDQLYWYYKDLEDEEMAAIYKNAISQLHEQEAQK